MPENEIVQHRSFRKNAPTADPVSYRARKGGAESPGLPAIYLRTLLRNRWPVLGFAILGCLLGFLATLPQPPLYRARTSLDIQALNENFMNLRAVETTDKLASTSADSFLQTEVKLLESASLMNRVVALMKKTAQSEATVEDDLLTRMLSSLHLVRPKKVSRDALIDEAAKRVKVKPLGMTRLVEISCESSDRKIAAGFCNTLANQFVEQDLEVRWESAKKTGLWLTRQLDEVRAKLRESEQLVQSFAQNNRLLFNEAKESVEHDRLRLLQAQLAQAEAERVAREAQYRVGIAVAPRLASRSSR